MIRACRIMTARVTLRFVFRTTSVATAVRAASLWQRHSAPNPVLPCRSERKDAIVEPWRGDLFRTVAPERSETVGSRTGFRSCECVAHAQAGARACTLAGLSGAQPAAVSNELRRYTFPMWSDRCRVDLGDRSEIRGMGWVRAAAGGVGITGMSRPRSAPQRRHENRLLVKAIRVR